MVNSPYKYYKVNTNSACAFLRCNTHKTLALKSQKQRQTEFPRNLLLGDHVFLKGESRGRYGRRLAYVYRDPDGLFVNEEIIWQGYGRVYDSNLTHAEIFRRWQAQAKEIGKGMWRKRSLRIPVLEDD